MYYIELFSNDEIPEEDFVVFFEDFNCIFTQYLYEDKYRIEVIFNELEDLKYFIESRNSSKKFNKITSILDKKIEIKSFNKLDEKNWINFLKPIHVGDNFKIVTPSFSNNYQNEIIINPSLAFGTGHHETTLGCIELIAKIKNYLIHHVEIKSVLDIGTGSGILSFFSNRIFECDCVGIDTDIDAIKQAKLNQKLNPLCKGINFYLTELDSLKGRFDLVVANISIDYISKKIDEIQKRIHKKSVVIFSGFLFKDLSNLILLLNNKKFSIIYIIHKNDWITIAVRRHG